MEKMLPAISVVYGIFFLAPSTNYCTNYSDYFAILN